MGFLEPVAGMIDFEALEACVSRAEGGDRGAGVEARWALESLCTRRTRWQWIIHGETENYRLGVVRYYCGKGKFVKAKRYATCGRGDTAYASETGAAVKVKPMCCGYRLCPRWSRRYGRVALRRVNGHLAGAPHGAIDHIVLTQKVIDGEPLPVTRERFEKKWKRVYRAIRGQGMRSALVTYHVKRTRGEGWHYHAHVVVEWGAGIDAEVACLFVNKVWSVAVTSAGELSHPVFYRHVCEPGEAITALKGDGQGEFWSESKDGVAQCLQYCVRDVLQGCENWVEGVDTEDLTAEFAGSVDGAKLHRLYGEWRHDVENTDGVEEEEEEPGAGGTATEAEKEKARKKEKDGGLWVKLGSMDSVLLQACSGVTAMCEFLESLALSFFNRSAVFRRLSAVRRTFGG